MLRPLLFMILTLTLAHLPAAEPWQVWTLDAVPDLARSVIITSRGDQVSRVVLIADLGSRGTEAYAGYGPAAGHLDHLQVPAAARALTAGDGGGLSVTGTLLRGPAKSDVGPATLELSLQVTRDGAGGCSGTLRLGDREAAVSGRVADQAALAMSNALAEGASWSRFHGDAGDFTGGGSPGLVRDPAQARLVWISEDLMPFQAAGSRFIFGPNGGTAAPIVHRGALYQWYYVPAGTLRDPGRAAASRDQTPEPWNLVLADEVVVCIDAASGATRWRTVIPLAGLTYGAHKNESQGHVLVADQDRIYMHGSAGLVAALDAATGAVLWRSWSPIDAAYEAAVARIAADGTADGVRRPRNRNSGHSPTLAGGVLVVAGVSDGNAALAGLDAADGRTLWQRNWVIAPCASPLRWAAGDQEWIIVSKETGTKDAPAATVHCLDPRSGEVRWQIDGLGSMPYGPTLHGDLLFVNIGTAASGPAARLAVYRLGEQGGERLWALPEGSGGVWGQHPGSSTMLVDGRIHTRIWPEPGSALHDPEATTLDGKGQRANNGLASLDPATGAVLARRLLWNGSNEGVSVGQSGLLLWFRESQHGRISPDWFDPATGEHLGSWSPATFLHNTGYQAPSAPPLVDGRIFVRGQDGIWCYDLRAEP